MANTSALIATNLPPPEPGGPFDLTDVLADELRHVGNLSAEEKEKLSDLSLESVLRDLHDQNLSALCLSGGGIRSATFGLGVVQSLAKHGLLDKLDYLSSVSGGGYLGSWLSSWIRVELQKCIELQAAGDKETYLGYCAVKYKETFEGVDVPELTESQVSEIDDRVAARLFSTDDYCSSGVTEVQRQLNETCFLNRHSSNPEPPPIRHLREYSNFLTPTVGMMSADTWTFFAIYVRNLFLNWTIFVPLIAAFLLVPRILAALTQAYAIHNRDGSLGWPVLLIGIAAGCFSIAFVVNKLPSKNFDDAQTRYDRDASVLVLGVLPLVIFAFCATTYWTGVVEAGEATTVDLWLFHLPFKYKILNFMILSVSIYLFGYIGYGIWRVFWWLLDRNNKFDSRPKYVSIFSGLLATVAGGAVLWLAARLVSDYGFFKDAIATGHDAEYYVCLAVPVFMLVFLIQSTLYVGLSSKDATDDDREWFARFGGWIFIVGIAWLAVNGFVLLWPYFLKFVVSRAEGWYKIVPPVIASVITVVSGLISLVGGFSSKLPQKQDCNVNRRTKLISMLPQIASAVFIAMIAIGLSYGSAVILSAIARNLVPHWPIWLSANVGRAILMNPDISSLDVSGSTSAVYLVASAAVLTAFGIFMACFINVNRFSLHGAYRDRLIRAYLGASHTNRHPNPFTGFDEGDNRQLHRLKRQKPFHVINATLNLVGGDNLAWQDRKAASFTMSPLYCGNSLLNYRRTNQYSRGASLGPCKHLRYCNRMDVPCDSIKNCQYHGKALRLGTAMAISGAAADPNMGYYSSPTVTFLLGLFNIRLGWWLGNTGKKGDGKDVLGNKVYTKPSPSIAVLPLINETLGRTSERKRYLNVTDGGHFENLAIYEMVRRRCQFIIVSDAAADEGFTFGEISNAIEKCRIDLGVEIRFRGPLKIYSRYASEELKKSGARFAIADIIYPEKVFGKNENRTGCLLYLRPTLYGSEPVNIKHYADSNSAFPHQSTGDQFFDEEQFEAYRELGFRIFEEILGESRAVDLKVLRKQICKDADMTKRKPRTAATPRPPKRR